MLEVWIVVTVIAIAMEIASQLQLVSIWAALGSIVALICDVCGVDDSIQIIVFFAVTFASLALTRPFVSKMTKKVKNTPMNADMNIGKVGKVTKIVDETSCLFRVSLGGEDWSATSADSVVPEIGSQVRVDGIEGVKLIVTQV